MNSKTTAERILVCGPRAWSMPFYVRLALLQLRAEHGYVTIVHGYAKGVDTMAGDIARELGFEVEEHPADWQKHGRGAGFERNIEMLESGVQLVVAIGWGRGTNHTMSNAVSRNIPTKWHHEWMVPRAA